MLIKLFTTFFKVGLFTIGGGYVMIPVIQKEVLLNGWLTSQQFNELLAITEMTPGPIAVNSATFIGYKMNGILGAIFATTGVVLPSFIIILLISKAYEKYENNKFVRKFMSGVLPAVSAVIASAAITIGKDIITSPLALILFICAFIVLYRTKLNLLSVLLISGILGLFIF